MIWVFLYLTYDDVRALIKGHPRAEMSNLCFFASVWFLLLPFILHAMLASLFSILVGNVGWWLAIAAVIWLYLVNPMNLFNSLRTAWFVPSFLRPEANCDVCDEDEIHLVILPKKEATAPSRTKPALRPASGEALPLGWGCFRKNRYEGTFVTKRGTYKGFVERVGKDLVPHIQNPPEALRKHPSHGACFRSTAEAKTYRIHLIGKQPSTVADCVYGTNSILERLGI